jgi:TonB-linked SusC/RagA family outer membrane protein
MKFKFSLLVVFLLFVAQVFAQTKTITGKVSDARTGEALPGVTIKAGNSNILTQTTSDGSFSISVPAATPSLIFSYIGFSDAEVGITSNTLDVKLTTSEKSLNEVVVVGYGQAVKRDITGSISKITSKDIRDFPAPSFESAMQNKAPGVVVESGSGKLGQSIKIRIRGTSSISANSQPLYVVDGLPVTSNTLSDPTNDPTNPLVDINPNDIESIEILKDASSSAIYGARAANGVVLITTKKGRNNQKTAFELSTNTSISNPARLRHFLNASQYVKLYNQAVKSDAQYDLDNHYSGFLTSLGQAIQYYQNQYGIYGLTLDQLADGTDFKNGEVNTDWQNLLYNHNAPSNQINLSAQGGDSKTRFFASGFYNTQDAIVINNKFYRYGGRLNLEHNPSDKLSIGINISVDRSQLNRVTTDNAFSTPGQLVAQPPITPLYDPETGELNKNTLYPNGLYDAKYNSDKQVTNRTIGNAYANYTILPSLAFRSEFGADILNLYQEAFQGKQTEDGAGIGKANTIISLATTYNTNNYFTYTPNLGDKHKLNVVAGMSYLQNDTKQSLANAEQTPSDQIKNLSGATSITFANSTDDRYTFLSYFLRANYTFNNKYLLSASIRDDGSSRFGPNNRYGLFPAFSAGWILSEENFLKNSNFISFLKIRASWGLTGNAEIGNNSYYNLYTVSNYPDLPGYIPSQLPNPDLKWEKTAQYDVGIDFGFLNSRISGELDGYYKKTSDLLLNINVPSTTGYTILTKNLGNMQNKGVEIGITSTNIDGKNFRWTTTFNAGYNKNKVLNIGGQIIEGGFGLVQRAVEGYPIGEFYGQKFLSVDPQTGEAQYLGEDGKPTTDYGSAARVTLGNSNPTWTGGLTNTLSYKNFDLNFFFSFVTGNKVYNAGGVYQSDGFYRGFDNQTTDILNAWKKPGDITKVPRIGYFYGDGFQNSSIYLFNGEYIRLKSAGIGYTLSGNAIKKMHMSSVRLYISGYNLFIITKYPGDPEVNTETLANIGGGQDFYTIPQARTFTFGLNVKF